MGRPFIRFAAALVLAALFVKADVFAQLTKLNVGYVGVTSDNAAAFIARETGIYARNGLDVQLIYPRKLLCALGRF
jgi:ABC-type nitrate/sulfonate/bicarbonate transport system substrate-binding protein